MKATITVSLGERTIAYSVEADETEITNGAAVAELLFAALELSGSESKEFAKKYRLTPRLVEKGNVEAPQNS